MCRSHGDGRMVLEKFGLELRLHLPITFSSGKCAEVMVAGLWFKKIRPTAKITSPSGFQQREMCRSQGDGPMVQEHFDL